MKTVFFDSNEAPQASTNTENPLHRGIQNAAGNQDRDRDRSYQQEHALPGWFRLGNAMTQYGLYRAFEVELIEEGHGNRDREEELIADCRGGKPTSGTSVLVVLLWRHYHADMDVVWDSRHNPQWDELHAAQAGAMQQDFAFGQAMQALGTDVLRAQIFSDERLLGVAQFMVRRIAGIFGFALCSRGPVWHDDFDAGQRRTACRLMARSLPQRRPRVVLFAPAATAGESSEPAGLPGMTRVMTGEVTVVIDTTASAEVLRAALHQKWRNRLAVAERSALKVHRTGDKLAQYRWLLDREGLQRQTRSYRALPSSFVPAWQQAVGGKRPALLTVRADLGRDTVAAMMFLIHGSAATYHLGWTNDKGRELSAHNLLLWRALPMLASSGVRQLDLGGVNTQRGASLARFKLGTGGALVHHPGTFL